MYSCNCTGTLQYDYLCIGFPIIQNLGMRADPSTFHEILCRQSFERGPTRGKGLRAQRALFNAGTLDNLKVHVSILESHGTMLRELIASVRFEPGDDVTLYGGFLEPERPETDLDTHTRHIPLMDFVLNGQELADSFPSRQGGGYNLGVHAKLRPRCESKDWERVICTTGLGYLANTVTICPLHSRLRPNVVVVELMLGRVIPGVPYASILVLQAGAAGIDPGDRVISLYEHGAQKEKYNSRCADRHHYVAAGRKMPMELIDVDKQ